MTKEDKDLLREYQETGLTPKQIYEIDTLYAEKCKEVARLHMKMSLLIGRIQGAVEEAKI